MIPAVLIGPGLRLLGYALVAASLFGAGAKWMHGKSVAKYDKLNAEYSQFKGGVLALGDAAKNAAQKQRLADMKAKEYADEENARRLALARTDIARLRAAAERNNSRGGSVPPAPAGSRCPDGAVCFALTEYQRTLGDFDARARRLADSCSKVEIDFNTAREWANRRTP